MKSTRPRSKMNMSKRTDNHYVDVDCVEDKDSRRFDTCSCIMLSNTLVRETLLKH